MLSGSHEVHIEVQRAPSQGALLAQAFSDFISASASLELSYRDLQAEVAELSLALLERNQALDESLSEKRAIGFTLERILEAMPCGVLVVNDAGVIRLTNPEAARLLALSIAQMPTLDAIQCSIGLDLKSNSFGAYDNQDEQELSFETSEGRHWIAVRRVYLAASTAALDRAGSGTGTESEAVLMLRDISERKRMEAEREAAREAVALVQVSALLAHEIRNPLASLELFAGLIADSPDRTEEWLSHLRAGIRSLSGTVNNVLTLHGGGLSTMECFDVLTEAALAVSFLQPLAQQVGVTLVWELASQPETHFPSGGSKPKDMEVLLRGNRTAFHQLLLNLCTNALRHSAAGGKVRVVCPQDNDSAMLRIAVIDNGCGIPEHHLPRLFEGGFSGSGTTPGLGLAVCTRLMQQHDGHIHVQSRLGHGSTFTLEFPRA